MTCNYRYTKFKVNVKEEKKIFCEVLERNSNIA